MFLLTPPSPSLDFESALNAQQLEAVCAPLSPTLVIAGAGSGKTRALTYRAAYLLEKEGFLPQNILLLTFTNKAAKEMLGRLELLTGHSSKAFMGGTFHSVAARLLRGMGHYIGHAPDFTIIDREDADKLLKRVIDIEDSAFLKEKSHPKLRALSEIISYSQNTRQSLAEVLEELYPHFASHLESLKRFAALYKKRKRAENLCDYDDLLLAWLRLLQDSPQAKDRLRQSIRCVLVDEYQDTNALQGGIVELMGSGHKNIMVVGDNWQSIYAWRGARFSNTEDFIDIFSPCKIIKIEQNYRSTPEILQLANDVMLNHRNLKGYPLKLKAHRSGGELPVLMECLDNHRQANVLVQCVEGLREKGCGLNDIVVLYRAHYHALELQVELSRLGIPYFVSSGVKFFEQAHVRDVIAQLRFVSNASDSTAFERFSTCLPKIGPKTAEKIYKNLHRIADKKAKEALCCLLDKSVLEKVPSAALQAWKEMAHTLFQAHTQHTQDPPEAPKEILRIIVEGWYKEGIKNLYDNFQSRQEDLEALEGFAARFSNLEGLLTHLVLLDEDANNHPLRHTEACLRLSTIHQAKGLEFKAVILIGLAEGLFPLKRSLENDMKDEELRLFYVAVTRAKEFLFLLYPRLRLGRGPNEALEPSCFLGYLKEGTYDFISSF